MSNPGETPAAPAATEEPAQTVSNTPPAPEPLHPALQAIADGIAKRATPTFEDLEAVVKALLAH